MIVVVVVVVLLIIILMIIIITLITIMFIIVRIMIIASRQASRPAACHAIQPCVYRELRGCQGMGVVSNNRFDRALFSILYMFKPSR